MTSRLPEGGVIASVDTRVNENRFQPAAALAVSTAEVTLAVTALTAGCSDAVPRAFDPAARHRFYIDLRPACRLPAAPLVDSTEGRRRVRWSKAPNADRYDVLGYAVFDGRLLFTQETRDAEFVIPAQASRHLSVVVRPRCGPIDGTPGYAVD